MRAGTSSAKRTRIPAQALAILAGLCIAVSGHAEEASDAALAPLQLQVASSVVRVWRVGTDFGSEEAVRAYQAASGFGHGDFVGSISLGVHYPFAKRLHVRGDAGVVLGGHASGLGSGRVVLGSDWSWFGLELGVLVANLPPRWQIEGSDVSEGWEVVPVLALRGGPKILHLELRANSGDALMTPGRSVALALVSEEIPTYPPMRASVGLGWSGLEWLVGWRLPGFRIALQCTDPSITLFQPYGGYGPRRHFPELEAPVLRFGVLLAVDVPAAPHWQ